MFEHPQDGLDHAEWAALHALGALTPEECVSFEQHLAGCAICQLEMQTMQDVADQIALSVSIAPPERLRANVLAQAAANASALPKGILFQRGGLLVSRSNELSWESCPIPGVWSKTLWVDTHRKYSTSLVRMEPNAVYPSHRHNDVEEVYLLDGDFLVEGVHMRPGDYCRSEPGSIHGESSTESGVLLLVFSSQQDELLG